MPQPQLNQDVIVIHGSDSEEGSKSDNSVVLTSAPSTRSHTSEMPRPGLTMSGTGMITVAGQAQASTGPTTIQPGAGPRDVIKVDSNESDELHESPLVRLQLSCAMLEGTNRCSGFAAKTS